MQGYWCINKIKIKDQDARLLTFSNVTFQEILKSLSLNPQDASEAYEDEDAGI